MATSTRFVLRDATLRVASRGEGSALRRHTGSDRTAYAGAAKTAVTHRVLGEILLVILLGEIERTGVRDLRGDRAIAAGGERLLVHQLGGLGGLALRRRRHVNS